jgi:hypothetical protein
LPKKKPRESHLWQVDPSVFEPLRKAGLFERHVLSRAKSFGKHALYTLAFIYPIVLVTLGVMFGGLVFWACFAGSFGLIWLVISRTGYSGNFANWNMGYKTFVGLFAAFGIYAAMVYGLIFIKLWIVPIFAAILVIALMVGVWKSSNR